MYLFREIFSWEINILQELIDNSYRLVSIPDWVRQAEILPGTYTTYVTHFASLF